MQNLGEKLTEEEVEEMIQEFLAGQPTADEIDYDAFVNFLMESDGPSDSVLTKAAR